MKFMTIKEIADILKLDKMTIYRYVKRGTLKAHLFGKEYRIKESDFEDFLKEARLKSQEATKNHKSCLGE